MSTTFSSMLQRSDRVAFLNTGTSYNRMEHFTSLSMSKNPVEYSRSYVDVPNEVTDVTGFSPQMSYGFDRYKGDKAQDYLCAIIDNERIGTDAIVDILVVDMTSKTGERSDAQYEAVKRSWSVIPDSEGDGTEAYTYSGSFRSNSEREVVKVTLSDDMKEATIVTGDIESHGRRF